MITSKRAYRATEIAPIAISLPFRPTGFFIMPSCSASGLNLRNWFYLTRIHPSTAFTQENYHAQTTVNYTEPVVKAGGNLSAIATIETSSVRRLSMLMDGAIHHKVRFASCGGSLCAHYPGL